MGPPGRAVALDPPSEMVTMYFSLAIHPALSLCETVPHRTQLRGRDSYILRRIVFQVYGVVMYAQTRVSLQGI